MYTWKLKYYGGGEISKNKEIYREKKRVKIHRDQRKTLERLKTTTSLVQKRLALQTLVCMRAVGINIKKGEKEDHGRNLLGGENQSLWTSAHRKSLLLSTGPLSEALSISHVEGHLKGGERKGRYSGGGALDPQDDKRHDTLDRRLTLSHWKGGGGLKGKIEDVA